MQDETAVDEHLLKRAAQQKENADACLKPDGIDRHAVGIVARQEVPHRVVLRHGPAHPRPYPYHGADAGYKQHADYQADRFTAGVAEQGIGRDLRHFYPPVERIAIGLVQKAELQKDI